jgi:hypothetical protein
LTPNDISENARALTAGDAKKGGTETVEGKRCQIYTHTSPGTGTLEYCIADNLIVRVVLQNAGTKTTITFTDYNANIEIKAPI